MHEWIKELPIAITVCNTEGEIIEMNNKACLTFADMGGGKLIGKNLRDCHKPESWQKIQEIISSGKRNIYTIEKNGNRKLIIQQPWTKNSEIAGIVELSIELPKEMPHHVR